MYNPKLIYFNFKTRFSGYGTPKPGFWSFKLFYQGEKLKNDNSVSASNTNF